MITVNALHRIGIEQTPEEFEEAIEHVIEMMPLAEWRATSAEELTVAEMAALKRGGFTLERGEYGANDPYVRGKATYAALVAGGLSVADAAAALHVDESRVRQRLAKRTLYGVKFDGVWRLPTFQFDAGRLIPGLERVVPALDPALNPVAVYQWFTFPDVDLAIDGEPTSPRAWLLHGGNPGAVIPLADALAAPL
jgi:hypothetical protein